MSRTRREDLPHEQIAAVDLGSNSFHLIVAHHSVDRLHVLDRIRERVALAAGLGKDGTLDDSARRRAIDCLQRIAERLRSISPRNIRVVGTNTFRKIRDGGTFLREAEAAMGHPIEVLGGAEEARLVYLGVRYDVGNSGQPMLAVDIGGGSTELALGEGPSPSVTESVQAGCVTWTARYFGDGTITHKRLKAAVLAAQLELEPIMHRFAGRNNLQVIASSGTPLAIEEIGKESGWAAGGIDHALLDRLQSAVIKAGHADAIDLPGLSNSRRPVLVGGLAILRAVFEAIGTDSMRTSRCSLREGVLVDMLGRIAGDDRRERSVQDLADHIRIDHAQSERVAITANRLFAAVSQIWKLDDQAREFLRWGAILHEVGLTISHTDYHRHGAYIVGHADLPGFSRTDQEKLAAIIRLHRKRISNNRIPNHDPATRDMIRDVALLLRLSVQLHRSRTDGGLSQLHPEAIRNGLRLHLDRQEVQANPLTLGDLHVESRHWERMERVLDLSVNPAQQSVP
ncbi:MAG: Ppx/GppA phosphatase family protein [Phycisphaerales bacterium]|nr:Ppx/GppA phosphatase family protein [Phycisphaerales bacterium]MDP6891044.1 Ppx/GppA phosphatase family protein [Phycisphaerales bacterium]